MAGAPARPDPRANRLLDALPSEAIKALLPHLTVLSFGLKQGVYEIGQPITHVYFPLSGVFSLLAQMSDNELIEVGNVGSEGMVGLPVFLGATTAPTLCFSQVPGYAARMEAEIFKAEVEQRPALHQLMHHYTQALFNQVAQGSACNRHHETGQRLARWLLMTHDRAGQDTFPLTHEFIAQMLGVQGSTATDAMQAIQQAGLVRYQNDLCTVMNRAGLEAMARICYRVITEEFNALIPRYPTMPEHPLEPWGNEDMRGPQALKPTI